MAGLPEGLPVAVSGHDHVCGALAVSAVNPGLIFNSMGTAESLLGSLEDRPLGLSEQANGFSYGIHVIPNRRYWMGGLSASGGSIEWLRRLFGDPPLSYSEIESLVEQAPTGPTGIVYFPYLSGSGSPHTDLTVRGAFIGLDAVHGRPHLAKAVLEGAAYEQEFIRRSAEEAFGHSLTTLLSAGGGTRSPHWMQLKADISGCTIAAQSMPETSLLGAALTGGVGAGLYADHLSALAALTESTPTLYTPDPERHGQYSLLYENGYLPLQSSLRAFGSFSTGE
jgi:sugar (pentulose or hexulose) kinase